MKEIREANEINSSRSPTAVFVGATSGIGLGVIQSLLRTSNAPRIFIIGRSQLKFAPTLAEFKALNPSATLTFIQAQVSLLKEVDRAYTLIKDQESSVDLLCLSQGGISVGHRLTEEGLNADYAVKYYSRLLFIHLLLPLLHTSPSPRVLSILAAGSEGPANLADPGFLDPNSFNGFWEALRHGVMITSLAMKELAVQNPGVSFVHANPGPVATDVHAKWAGTMTPVLGAFVRWVFAPLLHIFSWTSDEAGETGLFELTSERFGAESGRNFWRLDDRG
ncbi:Oxidoreductase andH [Lachnellula suecica]|uniref:Oxidoreductase andH n=1 Tax=Lachnellula suecica TaxID=602035 RepID=A0A8T9BZE3_9HELO|nr:Oxidoreductase andH [Lachnellula suecica]